FCPMVRLASSPSRNSATASGKVESVSVAMTLAPGISPCSISTRLAPSLLPKNLTPVRLPPGLLRLVARTLRYRISADHEHDGDCRGSAAGCFHRWPVAHNNRRLPTN